MTTFEPYETRTARALNEIVEIANKLKTDARGDIEISGLLNDVGMKFERDRATMAETYVVGKREDSAFEARKEDLNRLVEIIGVLEREHIKPAHAGYMIKKLNALRRFYGSTKGD